MYHLYQMLQSLYDSSDRVDYAAIIAIEKEIERWMIRSIYAPLKLREKNIILQKHQKKVRITGKEGESAVKLIANSLDMSIKGEFSKKVRNVTKEKAKVYVELGNVK